MSILGKFSRAVSAADLDRDSAVLIYDNEFILDSNHQFALQLALSKDKDNKLELDNRYVEMKYVDDNIDEVANLTYSLDMESKIACLDIYENIDSNKGNYLIFHTKESFVKYYDMALKYAEENNLILGYFKDLEDDVFYI